jgi:hypothetical protein
VKFIYLIQGNLSQPFYHIPAGSDFLYLQWQPNFRPLPHHFHFPNSTWAEGRNELYKRALQQGAYDYFVYIDDDVRFGKPPLKQRISVVVALCISMLHFFYQWGCNGSALQQRKAQVQAHWRWLRKAGTPWSLEQFEALVRSTNPLLAHPNYNSRHGWYQRIGKAAVEHSPVPDQCLVCLHSTIASKLLPYDTTKDATNWWAALSKFNEGAIRLIPAGKAHRYNDIYAINIASRPYPHAVVDRELHFEIQEADLSPL